MRLVRRLVLFLALLGGFVVGQTAGVCPIACVNGGGLIVHG